MIELYTLSMKNKFLIVATGFMTIMVLISSPVVLADDDYIEARRLYDSGEILPLEEILKHVRPLQPGKILEVELEKEQGSIVYELEILTGEGIVKEIFIDARTGQLLFSREED